MSITSNQISIWEVSTGRLIERTSVANGTLPRFSSNWGLVTILDEKTRVTNLFEYLENNNFAK